MIDEFLVHMRKEKQVRKEGDTPGAMLNKDIEASPRPQQRSQQIEYCYARIDRIGKVSLDMPASSW